MRKLRDLDPHYFLVSRAFQQDEAGDWLSIGNKSCEYKHTDSLSEAVAWMRRRLSLELDVQMHAGGKTVLLKMVGETSLRNFLDPADAPELDDFEL